jgi:hypothetical protein
MATIEKSSADRSSLIRWLALTGIIGSTLFAASGVWEMISPASSADGSQVLDSTHFRIAGSMMVLAYLGWLAIALAFYWWGATGGGWLGKIALVIMAVGVVAAVADQISRVLAVQETQAAPWQVILFIGAVFVAPILLGVAAWRARVVPLWTALYPLVMVAVVPLALWALSGVIGPGLVILLQGLLWLGFSAIVYAGQAGA